MLRECAGASRPLQRPDPQSGVAVIEVETSGLPTLEKGESSHLESLATLNRLDDKSKPPSPAAAAASAVGFGKQGNPVRAIASWLTVRGEVVRGDLDVAIKRLRFAMDQKHALSQSTDFVRLVLTPNSCQSINSVGGWSVMVV